MIADKGAARVNDHASSIIIDNLSTDFKIGSKFLISLLTGSQQGRKKIRRASEWESERRDSASEASGTRGSL